MVVAECGGGCGSIGGNPVKMGYGGGRVWWAIHGVGVESTVPK